MKNKRFVVSPIVWLIGIPIFSFIAIIFLANGIRELIEPQWIPSDLIPIISSIELIVIGFLAGISILCILILFWLVTKFISVDKLEDAFYKLKREK